MKNFYYQNKCTDIWYQCEKENGVSAFFLEPHELEKWMHQNGAECVDYIDGVLLDNMLVETKNGYAAIYERYQNCWSSVYYVEFERKQANTVWNKWYQFVDAVEREEA